MNSDGTARWLYVAACLLVPAIWGAGCAWLFGKLDARRMARLAEQGRVTTPAPAGEGK
jgi:hypothetical protein